MVPIPCSFPGARHLENTGAGEYAPAPELVPSVPRGLGKAIRAHNCRRAARPKGEERDRAYAGPADRGASCGKAPMVTRGYGENRTGSWSLPEGRSRAPLSLRRSRYGAPDVLAKRYLDHSVGAAVFHGVTKIDGDY